MVHDQDVDVAHALWMQRVLMKAVPSFYLCYYIITGFLSIIFQTRFYGNEPFEHEEFTPDVSSESNTLRSLVTWLSMILTFTLAGPWIVYFTVQDWHRAVDCATAIQMIHLFATVAVTQALPQNWVWWVTAMPSFLFQGRAAQWLLLTFGSRLSCFGCSYGRKWPGASVTDEPV